MEKTVVTFKKENFPRIYENGVEKAVIVDINIFEKLELIIDNLVNREPEPEDSIIAESEVIRKIIQNLANVEKHSVDWKKEIDEL